MPGLVAILLSALAILKRFFFFLTDNRGALVCAIVGLFETTEAIVLGAGKGLLFGALMPVFSVLS